MVRWPGYDAALAAADGAVGHLLLQSGGVKTLYHTRIFLQAALVRLVARLARKEGTAALARALDANEAAIPESDGFYHTDIGFHAVQYDIPQNSVLPAIHKSFTAWSPRWVKMPRSPQPQPPLNGRAHDSPQAHGPGCVSSVNAQVCTGGRPWGHDAWDAARLGDAALATQCKRLVKTNCRPASTARMGAGGDMMAVRDARMRVRGIDGLRISG